jgi:hypothetical protein
VAKLLRPHYLPYKRKEVWPQVIGSREVTLARRVTFTLMRLQTSWIPMALKPAIPVLTPLKLNLSTQFSDLLPLKSPGSITCRMHIPLHRRRVTILKSGLLRLLPAPAITNLLGGSKTYPSKFLNLYRLIQRNRYVDFRYIIRLRGNGPGRNADVLSRTEKSYSTVHD